MQTDQEIWTFPLPVQGGGEVEWVFEDAKVQLLRWKGAELKPDDGRLRLGNLPFSDEGTVFPAQFQFDPATGRRLRMPSADAPLSCSPNLTLRGFPVLPEKINMNTVLKRERTLVPQGAMCIFSAGTPARVFSIAHNGRLFLRSAPDEWIELEGLAAPDLPRYALGVVGYERGFATVLDNRAVLCKTLDGLPELSRETHEIDGAVFCAAPSIIEKGRIAFPVRRGDAVSIAIYDSQAQAWEPEIALEGHATVPDSFFAPAIQSSSQMPDTYWIGERTYLQLGAEYGRRFASLKPLPDGARAIAGVVPLLDKQGTVYVLAKTDAFYALISLASSAKTIPLEGPHLSAGQGRYIGRYYHPSLWDDEVVTLQIEAGAGRALLPLAYKVDRRGDTGGTLLMLVDGIDDVASLFTDPNGRHSGTLYWHVGALLHPLQITLMFADRHDIIVFCENDALIVGSARNGDFYRLTTP
jgi:hypothetical protein